jgi:hypothetical protein
LGRHDLCRHLHGEPLGTSGYRRCVAESPLPRVQWLDLGRESVIDGDAHHHVAAHRPLLQSHLSGVVDPRLQCVSAQRSGTARHLLLRRRRRDCPDPAGDANSGDPPDRDSYLYADRDADRDIDGHIDTHAATNCDGNCYRDAYSHGHATTDFDTDTVTNEHPHTSADCNSDAAAYCDGDTSADRHSYAATHFDTDAVTDEHPHASADRNGYAARDCDRDPAEHTDADPDPGPSAHSQAHRDAELGSRSTGRDRECLRVDRQ